MTDEQLINNVWEWLEAYKKSNAKFMKALTDQKFEIEKLRVACEVVVRGYKNDGMEDMSFRDRVFYQACKEALEKEK